MTLLTLDELKRSLRSLPGWEPQENALVKTFNLSSFAHGIILKCAKAQTAEVADHHPDLSLRGYNRLTITLSTHSGGGVTTGPSCWPSSSKTISGETSDGK